MRLSRVEKGEGCSNLVIALTISQLGEELSELCLRALPDSYPFRRLRLPVPGRSVLEALLDGRSDPAALLRKEGQCLSLVGHAFEELAANHRIEEGANDPALIVERLTALLCERLSRPISMAELIGESGMSHVTLNRIFRAATGMTVFEKLRNLRVETAERLIRHTDRSLTGIANDCGFSDASHLSNAFRKRYGTTAREWRRMCRKQNF